MDANHLRASTILTLFDASEPFGKHGSAIEILKFFCLNRKGGPAAMVE